MPSQAASHACMKTAFEAALLFSVDFSRFFRFCVLPGVPFCRKTFFSPRFVSYGLNYIGKISLVSIAFAQEEDDGR